MGKDGKPRGKMTAYAFFVQTCREEHKKKFPGEQIVFAEFSKKCAEKWKAMESKDKTRFDEMAEKDKARYEQDMLSYQPPPGPPGLKAPKRKRTKDPNAPKRSLSAFFFFCNEERSRVRQQYPSYTVGDIAKELGKRWEVCQEKPRFEEMAVKDKQRYEQAMKEYREHGVTAPKQVMTAKPRVHAAAYEDDEEEEEGDSN